MINDYLFVYGTLTKNSGHLMHRQLHAHSEFICHAWILGKLYQIHDYPGVIESTADDERVFGELYRLTHTEFILAKLDDFEECSSVFPTPHEYHRKQIDVYTSQSQCQKAWAYIYNHPVNENKRILSGHYC